MDELHDCGLQWDCSPWWIAKQEVGSWKKKKLVVVKRKNYAGSEKPLPTLIKEKEPLWHRVPLTSTKKKKGSMGIRRVAGLT